MDIGRGQTNLKRGLSGPREGSNGRNCLEL